METPPPDAPKPARSRRGFAAMDPEKQREIARKGGRASGGRPENLRGVDRREAGRKGGHAVVERYGPQHMAEIGRKGGRSSGNNGRNRPPPTEADGVGSAGAKDAPTDLTGHDQGATRLKAAASASAPDEQGQAQAA